jgi:hypothetical protein
MPRYEQYSDDRRALARIECLIPRSFRSASHEISDMSQQRQHVHDGWIVCVGRRVQLSVIHALGNKCAGPIAVKSTEFMCFIRNQVTAGDNEWPAGAVEARRVPAAFGAAAAPWHVTRESVQCFVVSPESFGCRRRRGLPSAVPYVPNPRPSPAGRGREAVAVWIVLIS